MTKWKGREKEYHKDYMRKYRRRKKNEIEEAKTTHKILQTHYPHFLNHIQQQYTR